MFLTRRLTINRAFGSYAGRGDPFTVLGLPPSCSYTQVKKAFARLALQHHPDMKEGSAEDFTKIRQAFESIQELEDGSAMALAEGSSFSSSDEDLSKILYEETGQSFSFFHMSSATRREMANVSNTMSQGGLDRGGMWELAAHIAREEKDNPSKDEPLQVEAGRDSSERTTRRRRK